MECLEVRANWVFLTVCLVYLCSGFMLVFSKLNNKVILDITVSLRMVIYDYMHIGHTK